MSKNIIDKKQEFLFTFASVWLDQLTLGMVKEFWENYFEKKGIKLYFGVIAVEEPTEEDLIKRKHIHGYIYCEEKKLNVKNLNIPLKKPVVVFYNYDKNGERHVAGMELNENIVDLDHYKEVMEYYNATEYKIITEAHPNVEFRKKYGSSKAMIEYVIKQGGTMWSTEPVDQYLARLKENKRGRIDEPDWQLWKNQGLTLKEVLEKLKSEYTNKLVKNYHKWSAGIHLVYGRTKENWVADGEKTYWIPRELYNWIIEYVKPYYLHRNDKEWLKNNRMNRPKGIIWTGPSKIGKTCFLRSICPDCHNYYQFNFDGMEDFEEDYPLVILDDFAREVPKYFPNWKCYLGGQTEFSINPKYGRRRKVDWGHPCAFLNNNFDIFTEENGFRVADMEYLKKNYIFIKSDSRPLWEKPKDVRIDIIEVKLKDLWDELSYNGKNNDECIFCKKNRVEEIIESDGDLTPKRKLYCLGCNKEDWKCDCNNKLKCSKCKEYELEMDEKYQFECFCNWICKGCKLPEEECNCKSPAWKKCKKCGKRYYDDLESYYCCQCENTKNCSICRKYNLEIQNVYTLEGTDENVWCCKGCNLPEEECNCKGYGRPNKKRRFNTKH